MLRAPAGVAARNIDRTTIHSGLGISVGSTLYSLNDRQWEALRNKFSEVRLIIKDEILMVSSVLFFQFKELLNEVFGYSGKEPFVGLSVIVSGDFYHLPLVKDSPIYSSSV